MLASEYRRDLAKTVGIVLLLSVVLAFIYGRGISLRWNTLLAIAGGTAFFAAGPFAGWIFAAWDGAIVPALWSLIPLTFFSIWPAVRAAQATTSASRRSRLALAGLVWLFSSFFYVVLIWT